MEIKKNKLVITEKEESSVMDIFRMEFPQNFTVSLKNSRAFLATFMLPVLNVLPKGFTVHF